MSFNNLAVDRGWATSGDPNEFINGRLASGWSYGADGLLGRDWTGGVGTTSDPTNFGPTLAYAKLANGNAAVINQNGQLVDTGQKWYDGDNAGMSAFGQFFTQPAQFAALAAAAYGGAAGLGNLASSFGASGLDAGMGSYGNVSGASTAVGGSGANVLASQPTTIIDNATGQIISQGGSGSMYGGAGADTLGGGTVNGFQTMNPWGGYTGDPTYGLGQGATNAGNWASNLTGSGANLGASAGLGSFPLSGNVAFDQFLQGNTVNLADSSSWIPTAASATGSAPGVLQKAWNAIKNGASLDSISKSLGLTTSAMSLLGKLGASALGAYGSSQQADSYQRLADQYSTYGAPSRARYEASFQPGFTMDNDPGYKAALDSAATANAHSLSTTFGNPAGSPTAQLQNMTDLYNKTAYPALQNYRSQNASAGGLQAASSAAPQLQSQAIGQQGNVFNAIGSGLNDIFNPPKSLAQSLAEYKTLSQAF